MSNPTAEASGHDVHLVGTKPGNVKNLLGFRKGFHKVPAMLPDTMFERQFPAMAATDLERAARELFDKLRAARSYKRKEINLNVDSPNATLTTSDFTLDVAYEPDPADPGDFRLTHDVHSIRDITVFADEKLNEALGGLFNRVLFAFPSPVNVEDVIDELEDTPGGAANLRYPPDASECTVRLPGFIGEVRVTARTLEVISPAGTSPAELVKTFVGATEILAKNPSLEKLIPRRRE